ncbi:uncharacterized protein LOC141858607 [Brevipalpus obovatus]|uniref:uncharacterized protein LOC141858607 n=1 Tax=Brevipalpus obovatus TaxID=246614 RepID=UPI003D9F981A
MMDDNLDEVNIIETTPHIEIKRDFDEKAQKLYVPPSNCSLSITDRFTKWLKRELRHDLNPGGDALLLNNTLFSRNKEARLSAAPYPTSNPKLERAAFLASRKLKKRSELSDEEYNEPPELGEDFLNCCGKEDVLSKYGIFNKKRWTSTNQKTREELDEDLEEYMAQRLKDEAMSEEAKTEESSEFDGPHDVTNPKYFGQAMRALKNRLSRKNIQVEDLDDDLDGFNNGSKKKLDCDLDDYWKAAPKSLKKKNLATQDTHMIDLSNNETNLSTGSVLELPSSDDNEDDL